MKKLLASTALAIVVGGQVLAQAATDQPAATSPPAANAEGAAIVLFLAAPEPGAIFASDLIGMSVYSSDADYSGTYSGDRAVPAADTAQWDAIGEVNDVVLSSDGQARGVLVDVGGFLGIGEHTVALDMSQVHLLRDETNRRFVAVNSSQEELENAPEFERPEQPPISADTSAMNNTGTMGGGVPTAAPGAMTRPAFEREGYMTADYDSLTAEQLQGASVYDAEDQNVGEVGQLLLSDDGKIEQAVVDVGGFLGMGEHQVALDYEEMQVMTNSDHSEVRVYIDQTREALEQRPEYQQ